MVPPAKFNEIINGYKVRLLVDDRLSNSKKGRIGTIAMGRRNYASLWIHWDDGKGHSDHSVWYVIEKLEIIEKDTNESIYKEEANNAVEP